MTPIWKTQEKRKGPQGEVLPEDNEGLPDSKLLSGLCPRCGKQSSFELLGSLPVTYNYEMYSVGIDGSHKRDHLNRVSSLLCRHCLQCVVVVEERWIGDHAAREGIKGGGALSYRGIHWWPLPETHPAPEIPPDIAGAFAEAVTALHANCPRASVVMARRTLEAITVNKGETDGTLAKRLETLKANGVLHPMLAEWAKEVRIFGNLGAHFDPIEHVSMADATQLIGFVRELLKYLYELPAQLTKLRVP